MPEEVEFTGAIVFCPCCVTNNDAEDWGVHDYECVSCGTKFSVDLDPEIVANYAMHGAVLVDVLVPISVLAAVVMWLL